MEVDKELIDKLINGDRKSQLALYRHYFSLMMSAAYRYHKNEDDAAAVVNEAFLKVLTNIEKYRPEVPFKAWMKRIVLNVIIDEYRKNKRRKDMFVPSEDHHPEANIHSETDKMMEDEYLDHLLKQLPNGTRVVFNMFAIDGYSHKEIAEELTISVETSKWHVKEARKRLKGMLNQKLATS